MASTGIIGAKRMVARREFLRQLQTLADQAGFEFSSEKADTEFQGAKTQAILGEMAQTRVDLLLVQLVSQLSERVAALESHARASTKRSK